MPIISEVERLKAKHYNLEGLLRAALESEMSLTEELSKAQEKIKDLETLRCSTCYNKENPMEQANE